MPLFRQNREDPQAPDLAETAEIRPHSLTEELLDWLLAALEAVIQTPEVQRTVSKRVRSSLQDAYKYADHLYPLTTDVQRRTMLWELENRPTGVDHAHQVREGEGLVLGLEGSLQEPGEGRAGSEGGLRPRLQEGE